MNRPPGPIAIDRESLAVYLVLDLARAGSRAAAIGRDAIAGGITCLQLRDKRGSMSDIERVASELRANLDAAGIPLIINDRLDVALGVNAAGVHVGQSDEPVDVLRARAARAGRPDFPVGVSVTTVAEGQAALDAGAAYLSVSPVFGTSSKPDAPEPAGLGGVRALRAAFSEVPIVGIGGIKPGHVGRLRAAGADGVAFVSAATDAASARAAVREMAAATRGEYE